MDEIIVIPGTKLHRMIKQGIDNCYFSHRYEHPGYEKGYCAGLRTLNGDGEPIDACKQCLLNYINAEDGEQI